MDPMVEFNKLQEEINRLFDFGHTSQTGLFDRALSPAIDLVEDGDKVTLYCDMPGVRKENLELSIAGNVLTLKGEKPNEKAKEGSKNYRNETLGGAFQRTISLPDTVDPNKVDAELKNGVLTLVIAKREEVKPRKITVNLK